MPTEVLDFSLHPKQGVAFRTEATEVLYGGAAGGGKALAIDTPIATAFGWKTMGEVRVGDLLFDEQGNICKVVAATPVMEGRPCYRMTFSCGASIVADADHQWCTLNASELQACTRLNPERRAKRRSKRPSRATGKRPDLTASNAARDWCLKEKPTGALRTTAEIAATLRLASGRANHAIEVCAPLHGADAELLIDPYVLGAWLGDGTSIQGAITAADSEIIAQVAGAGYNVRRRESSRYGHGVLGLQVELRRLGLLGNKHIPPAYLRASEAQRLALLQGIMDTDGYADDRGQCEISLTLKQLVDDVAELLASLGIKATMRVGVATLNGRVIGPKYRLKFLTEMPAFRLSRKLIRQKRGGFRGTHKRRYVVGCERIASVPVRCIQVDSPSHMFLAGREMIPTHNSFLMRVAAIMWCSLIPGLQVYLFRRIEDDLVKNHLEGPAGFRLLLTRWVLAGQVTLVSGEIRFANGSKIYLCHCKDEKDRFKYLGAEIHVLLIDELTTFTETIYRFLRSRVRMVGVRLPEGLRGKFPRILCGSNPGNIGHHWVKAMFVESAPPLTVRHMGDSEGGMLRQFIPALLQDNPSMEQEDPGYRMKLRGLGSPALVKAMEDGDWDVVAGAYFDNWSTLLHVIRPIEMPSYWTRFRAFDWGSARPFSVGWYAVSDGELPSLPRGALIRYREWYGAKRDESGKTIPNQGLRYTAEQVADGIKSLEQDDIAGARPMTGVADPSIFAEDGGPSIAQRMAARGISWRPADNTRVAKIGALGGWDQVRARLNGDGEKPALFFFNTCVDAIRTLPTLQHDPARIEDIDTSAEDHCADEIRYACLSRPYTAPLPPELEPERDRYAEAERRNRSRGRRSAMAA